MRCAECGAEIDSDTVFILMEFVDSVDLHTLLAKTEGSRLSPTAVGYIPKGCADALDYAHSEDVKNIANGRSRHARV
jgi:serine/threonine protein kinase